MHLPHSPVLTISNLAAAFKNTSATYKFYWLISIIESVELDEENILKKDLFARMICNAWYTVNYFRVSFGKQDLIQQAVQGILQNEPVTIDMKKEKLFDIINNSTNPETVKALHHFNATVPHWFLTPWFPKQKDKSDFSHKKRIYASSLNFDNNSLYALHDDSITVNPEWISYVKLNARILKDFCYWNLSLFLQTRNPNVPDIPNKLIKPVLRNTLSKQRNNYWNIVFKKLGNVECIFTGNQLSISNFALDHFIPHAFVSHDLIWNLIPVDKNYNSKKSDSLPSMEKYFDKFFALQKTAYEIVLKENPKSKLIEDYLTIFPQLASTADFDYVRYKESIQPLITIAHNNGFPHFND